MIVCKSAAELETMHRAGLVVWDVLNRLRQAVQPGITTLDLEKSVAAAISLPFVWLSVCETKGKTLEQMKDATELES